MQRLVKSVTVFVVCECVLDKALGGSLQSPRLPSSRCQPTVHRGISPQGRREVSAFTGVGQRGSPELLLICNCRAASGNGCFNGPGVRSEKFDSFDAQSHRRQGELGYLSHPGRRHKTEGREWNNLVYDREGVFLGLEKPRV